MSRSDLIRYIKRFYNTLHGKPVESLPDSQLTAVYFSLRKRETRLIGIEYK